MWRLCSVVVLLVQSCYIYLGWGGGDVELMYAVRNSVMSYCELADKQEKAFDLFNSSIIYILIYLIFFFVINYFANFIRFA